MCPVARYKRCDKFVAKMQSLLLMALLLVLRMMPEPTASAAPRISLLLKYSLFAGQACAHGFVSLPWAVHLLRNQHGLNHPSFVLVRGRSSSVYRCRLLFLMRAA